MASETIAFELAFKSNWWKDPPHASIYIDGQEKFNDSILTNQTVKFTHTLDFTEHVLSIRRSGKNNQQVKITEQGVQGQDLIIDQIKIDGVNIRNLIWTNAGYYPEYPEPWASQEQSRGIVLEEYVAGETHLGHNGTWELKFTSPFYRFLMDCMG